MGRYDVLLCDADDTLFDFTAAERAAFSATMAALGYPHDDQAYACYDAINTALWAALERGEVTQAQLRTLRFERFMAALSLAGDPHAAAQAYIHRLGEQALPLPGALAAVPRWAARVKVVILTNGIAAVQRSRISRSPIRHSIAGLVISEEVGAAKPDPRMVAAGIAAAGATPPERVLVLGDSLRADIAGAQAAGVDSCWYNPHHLPCPPAYAPTYTVHNLDAVDALL